MLITKQMLLDKKACSDQVELFVSLFGEEAKVTKANCLKAYEAGIDFEWAADNLLTYEQRKHYKAIQQPALKEYLAIRQPAWEEYLAIRQSAWEAYEAIKQQAWKAYLDIQQPAWEAYNAIKQSAFKAYEAIQQQALGDYKKQCALAFYTAFKGDK